MLDDEQFARQWVESRDRAHPRGEHALIIELRQKGIDATTIATILKDRREVAVERAHDEHRGLGAFQGLDAQRLHADVVIARRRPMTSPPVALDLR